jgi:hypothetical protein
MQGDDDNAISPEVLYDPTTLPAIVAVDVVLLGKLRHSEASVPLFRKYLIRKTRRLTGYRAHEIASHWRDLSICEGGGMRCHTPSYGLRFHSDQGVIFETTICWHCFNFYLTFLNGFERFVGFDARSDSGKSLLRCCLQSGFSNLQELLIWGELGLLIAIDKVRKKVAR